ncbi:photosystem reaction center subunit H [Aminobacter sp. DSM 101952]|uniref:PRC-barrel domain-containing protein n=1 Tax=Aminobacter sp. DSM 101952 TaxID=2735891 RepID=UPI0006F8E2CB|nr:PRC-barrel domain-containing protein [Aminobacter sp. DSM 101952]KQU72417.1 photosystem reaction center subunit H [Aminobacter sp. DSM 101952]
MRGLIDSDKVIGTEVYGTDQTHIGEVKRLVLEKVGGRVAYAEVSFGGFLGIGEDYYPIPWGKLTYSEELDGFQLDVTKEQLESAPKYNRVDEFDWSEENNRRIYDYYGARPYW